jgi:hypothetical protein
MLTRYVEGVTLRELVRISDAGAIEQAAFSAGETLANIGQCTFPKSGWLSAGPSVTAPLLEGVDANPRFVDLCQLPADVVSELVELVCATTEDRDPMF